MKIAKFYKVSYEQYKKDVLDCFPCLSEAEIEEMYNNIKLPKRSTKFSAGYDFFAPAPIIVNTDKAIKFPTGIRCEMAEDYFLMLVPRSSLGFKYGTRLLNTVAVVDCDYFNAENEGHIFCKFIADKQHIIETGNAYMQGIFLQYGLTIDDAADGVRTGGFGSTDRREGTE